MSDIPPQDELGPDDKLSWPHGGLYPHQIRTFEMLKKREWRDDTLALNWLIDNNQDRIVKEIPAQGVREKYLHPIMHEGLLCYAEMDVNMDHKVSGKLREMELAQIAAEAERRWDAGMMFLLIATLVIAALCVAFWP